MAKLIYVTNVSLDGFIEDEHGDFDWTEPDDEQFAFITDLIRPVGTYLQGRRIYETMAVWLTDPALAARSDLYADFARVWQAADKIVWSTTLDAVETARTQLERRFDPGSIRSLKAAADRDLTVSGAELAAQAFRAQLVDECHLFISPVVLGRGKPALPGDLRIPLELVDHRRFDNGVVYLRHRVADQPHPSAAGRSDTDASADRDGVEGRLSHQPMADRLLAHLSAHHGIDAVAATRISQHNDQVFRVDRRAGDPWIARVFPPARPRAGAEGDAAILRFLERHGYPAERLASDEPVSAFDGSAVLITRCVPGRLLPSPAVGAEGDEKFAILGDLLGRLHALPLDQSVARPGGASGEDPRFEGSPRQDLLAALAFLEAVDAEVADPARPRFEELRHQVRSADDGHGLPEALLHGNLLHAPDHVIVGEDGPVAIQWKAAGRGPRLADFAYLVWGTWLNPDWIAAAVGAYRRHIELTDEELDRLEAVLYVRPLYLACFDVRRALAGGHQPTDRDGWWHQPDPDHLRATAAATRAALRR